MADKYCLLCLEIIVSSEKSQASSSSHSLNSKLVSDDDNISIAEEFSKFCKTFLQTDISGGKVGEGVKESNLEDDKSKRKLNFCKDCQVLVGNVLKLFEARNVIEAKLLWKLYELKGVISKSKESHWTANGGEIIRDKDWTDMEELRKSLVDKCTTESRVLFPFVVLNKSLVVKTESSTFSPSKYHLDFMLSMMLIMALNKGWNLAKLNRLRFLHPKVHPYKSRHTPATDIPLKSNSIRDGKRIRQRNRKPKQNINLGRKNIRRSDENCSRVSDDPDPIWSPEDNVEVEEINAEGGTVRDKVCIVDETGISDVIIKDELDLDSDCASNLSLSLTEVEDHLLGTNVLPNEALVSETAKAENRVDVEKQNTFIAESNLAEEPVESGESYHLRKRSAPKHFLKTETYHEDDDDSEDECKSKTKGRGQKRSMSLVKKACKSKATKPRVSSRVYQCKICKEACASRKDLRLHKLKHKKPGLIPQEPFNYECKLCSIRVGSSFHLYDHTVRKHHGGPEKLDFKCKTCNTKLPNSKALVRHLKEFHEDPQQKSNFCPFCSESFTTAQYMNLHWKRAHWKLHSLLFCDDNECRKSFFSIEQLNSHMKEDPSHQNRQVFHCEICNRGHFSPVHLQLHRLNHIPKVDECYPCPHLECTRNNSRLIATLVNHYNSQHIGPTDRILLFNCHKCKRHHHTFSQGEFEHHTNNFHANKPQFRCHICDQEWPTWLGKRRHLDSVEHLQRAVDTEQEEQEKVKESLQNEDTHKVTESKEKSDEPISLIKCDVCEENFTSKLTLKLHRKTEHPTAPRPRSRAILQGNICEICGKVLQTKYHLKRHKSTHVDSQHACSQCGKLFRREDHLKIHINRFHTKEQVLVCDVCGRPCVTKSELKYHRKEHQLLHSCNVCQKKFSRGCTLQYHMRIHTGEKLQCEWCPAQYAALGNMKSHVKSIHPEEYQRYYGNTNQRTLLKYRLVKPGENDGGNCD